MKLLYYVRKKIQTIMMVLLGAIIVTFQIMNHLILRGQMTNYVRKRIEMMLMFLLGAIMTSADESSHTERSDSNQT